MARVSRLTYVVYIDPLTPFRENVHYKFPYIQNNKKLKTSKLRLTWCGGNDSGLATYILCTR